MRVFLNKEVKAWAKAHKLNNKAVKDAVAEIEQGLIDADLGGNLIKKRIALPGRGKRGGARTILAYKSKEKVFFLHGFAKNEKDNITRMEKIALKALAQEYFNLSATQLKTALKKKVLFEVNYE